MNNRTMTFANAFLKSDFYIYTDDTITRTIDGVKYEVEKVKLPTITEWRIFLWLVSKVNPFLNNSEFEEFMFTRAECIEAFGFKKNITKPELKRLLLNATRKTIVMENAECGEGIPLLSRLKWTDDFNTFTIKINSEMSKFLLLGDITKNNEPNTFVVDEDITGGYTSIPALYNADFKTTYAVRLYLYLYAYSGYPVTKKTIKNLRKLLKIEDNYETKNLIRFILKPALKEINDKTDLSVNLELVKDGKSYAYCSFGLSLKNSKKASLSVDEIVKEISNRRGEVVSVESFEKCVDTIVNTVEERYGLATKRIDVYKLFIYAGGDPNKAFNIYKGAIEVNAKNKLAKAKAIANKNGLKPLEINA